MRFLYHFLVSGLKCFHQTFSRIHMQILYSVYDCWKSAFYVGRYKMPKWSMPITNCKKVLPGFAVQIRSQDMSILVDFIWIGRDATLLGSVGESHDVLEKIILLFFHLNL